MNDKYLYFRMGLNRKKPQNMHNREVACPFCDVENLTDILATDGSIIWLMNKYPVLVDTTQTVIIETDQCDSEFSQYSLEHTRRLLRFAISKWQKMQGKRQVQVGHHVQKPRTQFRWYPQTPAYADCGLEQS